MKGLNNKLINIVNHYLERIYHTFIAIFYYFKGGAVFVCYFTKIRNVGDLLNINIIEYYSGKNVVKVPIKSNFKHCLVIGSVLQNMTQRSVVFGSGLIHDSKAQGIKELGDIRALRGHLTLECLEKKFNKKINVPLGDPALLFPKIYNPEIEAKYNFGLVLHYVDESHNIKALVEKMGGRVISVKQSPKSFVDEIKSCKCIISSAMHGLILSDAYDIPNKRVILSDKIVGGNFKFSDYYSTTNNPEEQGVDVSLTPSEDDVMNIIDSCTVKNFIENLSQLESSLRSIGKLSKL